MTRHIIALLAATVAVATTTLLTSPAAACGGCFVGPSQTTVVTGHRMALSISSTQTVLWDQIQYSGEPEEFSWVLPIKSGAHIEVATDAWFDVLDAATATTVQSPPEGCNPPGGGFSFGCASSALDVAGGANAAGGVTVVHKGTVGPYETVTLKSEDPQALNNWLEDNGYSIPDDVKPTIAAYVGEGFDFLALRLQPGQGVQQMKPVRVVTPGGGSSLPLRMVAAGVGNEVGLVLYVIGEGRFAAQNFENTLVPSPLVSWDYATDESNYSVLRAASLTANGGRMWLTSYAQRGPLLSPRTDPIGFGAPLRYISSDGQTSNTIAGAYFQQGIANQELTSAESCPDNFDEFASSTQLIVNPCSEDGSECDPVSNNEIDVREFACGELDDLAVALTGMHPADVFITRLEAQLPRTALDVDLLLEPSEDQRPVESRFTAGLKINACPDDSLIVPGSRKPGQRRLPPGGLVLLALGAAGLWLGQRRHSRLAVAAY